MAVQRGNTAAVMGTSPVGSDLIDIFEVAICMWHTLVCPQKLSLNFSYTMVHLVRIVMCALFLVLSLDLYIRVIQNGFLANRCNITLAYEFWLTAIEHPKSGYYTSYSRHSCKVATGSTSHS